MMTEEAGSAEGIIARMEQFFLDKKSNGHLHTSEMRFYFAQNALLADDMETALDRLQLAVDAGWRDYFLLLHDPRWASIMAGQVYRGNLHPELRGLFFYADFYNQIQSAFRWNGVTVSEHNQNLEISNDVDGTVSNMSSIALGADGELYATSIGRNRLYRLQAHP